MMRKMLWVFALTILTASATSNAALTVSLQPSQQTFLYGTNTGGFFDVYVTSTGGDAVGSYGIALDILPPDSGVQFREEVYNDEGFPTSLPVTRQTSAPDGYIFGTRGSIQLFTEFGVRSRVEYLDRPMREPFETTIASDDVYGAGRVFFEIAAGAAPGVYTFDFDESVSRFFDINDQPITTTYTNATITILPAGVPEPSTTLLLGLTGVVGFGVSRLRKRRQASATTSA